MMELKCFVFNPFGVNTYVLYNENNEAILIDVACYDSSEEKTLESFINEKKLNPLMQINTHCHIDHILGNSFAEKTFGTPLYIHKSGAFLLDTVGVYASAFGIKIKEVCNPAGFIDENSEIKLGNSAFNILYTPGHADGSICLVNHNERFVITGDTLFRSGIGRADLPTGNMDLLINNIKHKLMTLPEDYLVYPGHGSSSVIGFEKNNNPFL